MGEAIATVGDLAGMCGYDGSDWRKSNLLWGYHDTVAEALENTNLSGGYNALVGTAVPAGEVWVVTAASIRYVGTVAGVSLYVGAGISPTSVFVVSQAPPVSNIWYPALLNLVLKEGDAMNFTVFGATAGDDLYGRYAGYVLKVDM